MESSGVSNCTRGSVSCRSVADVLNIPGGGSGGRGVRNGRGLSKARFELCFWTGGEFLCKKWNKLLTSKVANK